MKLSRFFFCFLFFIGCWKNAVAQLPKPKLVIDSLNMRLQHAKHDTDRIKLRYQIGDKDKITRTSYWDSLRSDAEDYHLPIIVSLSCYKLGGIAHNVLHDQTKAIQYLKEGLKIAEGSGSKTAMIPNLLFLIALHQNTSDTKTALDYCIKGLKVSEELNNKLDAGRFRARMSIIFWLNGETKKALELQLRCLEIFTELNHHEEIVRILLDIGTAYQTLNQTDKSIEYFLQPRKYAKYFNEHFLGIEIYKAVGAAYNMKKEYDSADFYLNQAHQMALRIGLNSSATSVLVTWAYNTFDNGNINRSEKQAVQALNEARAFNLVNVVPVLKELLTKIYEKKGNYKKALEFHRSYIASRDSVSNEENRKKAMEKQFAYEFGKKENENKLLAQQNQIQSLQLNQNRYLIVGLGGAIVLILVIAWLFIRQNKFRSAQKSIQLEQKLLRSQMNPHFIFNSLQAIQNFILKQEGKEAIRYLSSFAFITRTVLENSRMDHTSLKKELVLVENYLQLQKLRFGNSFEYSIHVDEEINAEEISIPPMLTQPFIENAIEHGMQGIEEGGRIDIFYKLRENFLTIEITDNGWGMRYGNFTEKKHKSLAMEITKERIALMNRKERRKTSFTIGEAFSNPGERKGVKVVFSLPLQLSA